MANTLIVNPEGATINLMVTELTAGASPGLSPGGGGFGGPETISVPTTVYLANPGEVLVSMQTLSGAQVASEDGEPLRIMVSGSVTVNAFLSNEDQAARSAQVGGWPGDMRPFPGHWYGPRISASLTNSAAPIYQKICLSPVTVVDGVAAVAFRGYGIGTTEPVTVAMYNSDRNNWPSTLVWSTVLPDGYEAYETVEVDGPNVQGQPTIEDGLYWLTVVSFDDIGGPNVYGYCDYNSGYGLVGNAPFPSFGPTASGAFNNVLVGSGGQVVIHATSLGGNSAATVTELPTTITPGVELDGSYYAPTMVIKSAWGG
jgi:hypothetical protein